MAGDDPITDQPNAPPGHWAAKAIKTLWPSGRKGSFLYGPILPKLQNLDAVREPSLRPSREWKAEKVDFNIDLKRQNVEALLVQTVGKEMNDPCESCQNGQGLFVGCVSPECADIMPQCANCHWGKQGHRCSFAKMHKDGPAPSTEKVGTAPMASKKRKLAEIVDEIEMAFDHSNLLLLKQALRL